MLNLNFAILGAVIKKREYLNVLGIDVNSAAAAWEMHVNLGIRLTKSLDSALVITGSDNRIRA